MKKAVQFAVKAEGMSMFPLLQSGDTIEYAQIPFHKIKLNDIVLFYLEDKLITHRVIYKTKSTCITRGDNNPEADPAIRKCRVLAKVVRFKRKNKWHDIQEVYLTQSAFYLHEIQMLETVLRLHKIPHVFLKGVLVSLRYEGSVPKRIYADCDILVPRGSYKHIENIFALLGYKSQALAETDSIPYFKQIDQQPEVNFVKIIRGVPVVFDVHFEPVFLMSRLAHLDVLYPNKLLYDLGNRILSRGISKKIKGFSYSLCSVSDQMLYLALHIFHHNFTDSPRYRLLDSVIRKQGNKKIWKELQQSIIKYRLEGYTYLVFILLKKYFKTPVPPSFLQAIRPVGFKSYVVRLMAIHVDIFSQDSRVKAGIERFILIFLLSPEPIGKKLLLFIHPDVFQTGIRLIFTSLSLSISQVKRRQE